jgi:aminoglycoside phosphotransferase (APT) family kinase protein
MGTDRPARKGQAVARSKPDIAAHLAADAWRQCCLEQGCRVVIPASVVALQPQGPTNKSGVYRLEGAAEDGSAVIAKRCLRPTWEVERTLYERVLPRIDVPALRYYGCFEEAGGDFCWLFMQDAGETKLADADRAIAADWLARLHTGAAALVDEIPLPERGPAHYLDYLRSSRATLDALPSAVDSPREDQSTLAAVRRLLEEVERQWGDVCAPWARFPRTLVHGDFNCKNSRFHPTPGGPALVALDWETAGWGPPAADLGHWPRPPRPGSGDWDSAVPLDAYAQQIDSWGRGVKLHDVERLARVGTVFRLLASIRWTCDKLMAGDRERSICNLGWYAELLAKTLSAS